MHASPPRLGIRHRSVWLALTANLLLWALPGHAEVTLADLQVAARALSFVADPPNGPVRLGIVYAPGNARSTQQARELQSLMGDGFAVGAVRLLPVLVPADQAATADVDLFFLTGHLDPGETPSLSASGRNRQPLCLTTDIAQVRRGSCIVGIRSRPRVEVLVNRAAASAAGVSFSTVFRVMITEL